MLLKSSDKMNIRKGLENRLIRIPENLRLEYNFSLGELLVLDTDVVLQVEEAFQNDLDVYGNSYVFVTSEILNKVGCAKHTLKYAEDVTLGCDPEMFLLESTTGHMINPAQFFKKYDAIGYDGMLCELRPLPSVSADDVSDRLGSMIKSVRNTLDAQGLTSVKTVCRSSYGGIQAGFHCHMGLPKELLNKSLPSQKEIIKAIVRALDYYVGVLAVIPEGSSDSSRRCAPFVNYGKVSDHRADIRTLEYRVPGGALLKSKVLSSGLLDLCSLVTKDAITRLKMYTHDFQDVYIRDALTMVKHLYPNVPDTETLYKLICVPNTDAALKHTDKVISKDLSAMFNFKTHSKNIDRMLSILEDDSSNDACLNWGATK